MVLTNTLLLSFSSRSRPLEVSAGVTNTNPADIESEMAAMPADPSNEGCSAPTATSADHISARVPMPSASQSIVRPRTNGSRLIGPLYSTGFRLSSWTTSSPCGLRTATATRFAPRIITPSITACPP